MKIYENPKHDTWEELVKRPMAEQAKIANKVQEIIDAIKMGGDSALLEYTQQFDKIELQDIEVSEFEINSAEQIIPHSLKNAINTAKENIEKFHAAQLPTDIFVETMPGVKCWQKAVAIDSVGLYIPGGTAPLFSSVLMLAIPAKLAGCKNIILCTPPTNGRVDPVILYAAKLCGVDHVYQVGGAQAIAAMAYGTETIPAVHKIYGPGNQYVNTAKQLVSQSGVAIDLPAGPTELAILADDFAEPSFIAADLLAQLEHGTDSHVILVTTDKSLVARTLMEIKTQLQVVTRKTIIESSFKNSKAVIFDDIELAIEFVNLYAAEHLTIATKNYMEVSGKITSAGSIFLGNYSPESAGDYCSGPNHTLPTNGAARAFSGVNIDSFVKKITYQEITKEGLQNLIPVIDAMAQAEGLSGHRASALVRNKD